MRLELGRLDLHIHFESEQQIIGLLRGLDARLTTIAQDIAHILQKEESIMATLDDIAADVADEATVVGSVEQLLTNLSQLLKDALAAGADPVKVQAIKDAIDQNKARLAAAVAANTPGAPTP